MPAILAGHQGCIQVRHGERKSVAGKRSLVFRGLQGEQPWYPPGLKGPLGLEFRTRKVELLNPEQFVARGSNGKCYRS